MGEFRTEINLAEENGQFGDMNNDEISLASLPKYYFPHVSNFLDEKRITGCKFSCEKCFSLEIEIQVLFLKCPLCSFSLIRTFLYP